MDEARTLGLQTSFEELNFINEHYLYLGENIDTILKHFHLSNLEESPSRKCLLSLIEYEQLVRWYSSQNKIESFLEKKDIEMQIKKIHLINSMIKRRMEFYKHSKNELLINLKHFERDISKLRSEFEEHQILNKNIKTTIPEFESKIKHTEKMIDEGKYTKANSLDNKSLSILSKFSELNKIKNNIEEIERKIEENLNFPTDFLLAKELKNEMKMRSEELDKKFYRILKK